MAPAPRVLRRDAYVKIRAGVVRDSFSSVMKVFRHSLRARGAPPPLVLQIPAPV
jgi:hypothetical protein